MTIWDDPKAKKKLNFFILGLLINAVAAVFFGVGLVLLFVSVYVALYFCVWGMILSVLSFFYFYRWFKLHRELVGN